MPLYHPLRHGQRTAKLNREGHVVLHLKSPYHAGPPISGWRLAALSPSAVPHPRLPLIRYPGVLAPKAKLRAAIVPSAAHNPSGHGETPPSLGASPVEARAYTEAHYFQRNLRMMNVLIDRDAIKRCDTDEPWRYYDLGHGFCSYE